MINKGSANDCKYCRVAWHETGNETGNANKEDGVCLNHVVSVSGVERMLNMKIGDVIKLVDVSGGDEKQMAELVEDLREAFKQWVIYEQHNNYHMLY